MWSRSVLLSAILLAAPSFDLRAQPQYPPYSQPANPQISYYQPFPSQQPSFAPARPPSWYYNPYTSGLTPCSHPEIGKCGPRN